jgi:hypothetical protein
VDPVKKAQLDAVLKEESEFQQQYAAWKQQYFDWQEQNKSKLLLYLVVCKFYLMCEFLLLLQAMTLFLSVFL